MKKTWYFGIALALGVSSLCSMARAQYATPYSNGALAPSGYAINQNYGQQPVIYTTPANMPSMQVSQQPMTGVAQLPQYLGQQYPGQQFQGQQFQGQQYPGQSTGPMMYMVAYPQEQVAAPSVNANQAVQKGWVGPNQGVYQPTPLPDPVPMHAAPMNSAPMNSVPMQGAPMNSAPYATQMNEQVQSTPIYADQSINGGCADGCNGGYGASPGYGSVLAPGATGQGYGGCGDQGYGAPVYGGPVYGGPVYAGRGVGLGGIGGFVGTRAAVPGKAYIAGGSALLMRRVDDHNVALSYNTGMPSENILGTSDARQYHLNGFEVFMGRYFNGGKNALLVNYWGLYPEDRSTEVTGAAAPTGYRSRYHFNGIEMPTQTVYDWFDGARSHRISRGSQYHNIEANLLGFAVGGAARTWSAGGVAPRRGAFGVGGYGGGLGGGGYGGGYDACGGDACGSGGCGPGSCGDCGTYADCGSCGSGCAAFTGPCGLTQNMCGSKLNWTWLGGFRYFRFKDDLQYAASNLDDVYNGADDIYYNVNVRNTLYGFQLGGAGTYCLGRRINLYALSKGGIYNNHAEFNTRIYRGGGGPNATINSGNSFNGQDYMVDASKNNAAFMGEFGTGVGMRISRGWSANVGYRVIGAAGVATAVNNIPIEMIHLGNVADFNNTSSLLLHGWNLGGMYNF